MTVYFDNERIERAMLAVLQADFPAALVTVAARWALEDPEDLPGVVTWGDPGYNPTAIEKSYSDYPYVEVLASERSQSDRPGAITDQRGGQQQRIPVTISFILVSSDIPTVNKIAKRYAEALCVVLDDNHRITAEAGRNFKQEGAVPVISLSLPGRYSKHTTVGKQGANMHSTKGQYWMIAGTVETVLYG